MVKFFDLTNPGAMTTEAPMDFGGSQMLQTDGKIFGKGHIAKKGALRMNPKARRAEHMTTRSMTKTLHHHKTKPGTKPLIIPKGQKNRHIAHHVNNSINSFEFANILAAGLNAETPIPSHLLFKEENFRHDAALFTERSYQWPAQYKTVQLHRLMHEDAELFGVATSVKFIVLLGKVFVTDNLNGNMYNTFASTLTNHNMQGTSYEFSDLISKMFRQKLHHGKETPVALDMHADGFFSQKAEATLSNLVGMMTRAQFNLREFYDMVSGWMSLNDIDGAFSECLKKNHPKDLKERMDKAYNLASKGDTMQPENCNGNPNPIRQQCQALEVAVIKLYLEYYTQFHNSVLQVINTFCHMMNISEHIPTLCHMYRTTILNLTNDAQHSLNTNHLMSLQLIGSKIVDWTNHPDYIQKIQKRIVDSLTQTHSEGSINTMDAMLDRFLKKDVKIQSMVKAKIARAFRIVEFDTLKTTLQNFHLSHEVHDYKVEKRENAGFLDAIVKHLNLKDYFVSQSKYADKKYSMQFGHLVDNEIKQIFSPPQNISECWDMNSCARFMFSSGYSGIPIQGAGGTGTPPMANHNTSVTKIILIMSIFKKEASDNSMKVERCEKFVREVQQMVDTAKAHNEAFLKTMPAESFGRGWNNIREFLNDDAYKKLQSRLGDCPRVGESNYEIDHDQLKKSLHHVKLWVKAAVRKLKYAEELKHDKEMEIEKLRSPPPPDPSQPAADAKDPQQVQQEIAESQELITEQRKHIEALKQAIAQFNHLYEQMVAHTDTKQLETSYDTALAMWEAIKEFSDGETEVEMEEEDDQSAATAAAAAPAAVPAKKYHWYPESMDLDMRNEIYLTYKSDSNPNPVHHMDMHKMNNAFLEGSYNGLANYSLSFGISILWHKFKNTAGYKAGMKKITEKLLGAHGQPIEVDDTKKFHRELIATFPQEDHGGNRRCAPRSQNKRTAQHKPRSTSVDSSRSVERKGPHTRSQSAQRGGQQKGGQHHGGQHRPHSAPRGRRY
jgi:hypothetical protein